MRLKFLSIKNKELKTQLNLFFIETIEYLNDAITIRYGNKSYKLVVGDKNKVDSLKKDFEAFMGSMGAVLYWDEWDAAEETKRSKKVTKTEDKKEFFA